MTKIMLVEDDKSLREIYGVRLLAEGYDIVSAGDGEEALAMAIKERPQLIVSDVMMPKISGFDMLDILRSTTETKNIKVIMMTALSSEEQRARGESLGADRYLVKSQVGIEDVVRVVHEVLGDNIAPPAQNTAPNPMPAQPAASTLPQPGLSPIPAPAAPVPTPPAPTRPATPTLKDRVISPIPDNAVTPVNIGELLDKELATAAGITDDARPTVPNTAQERQLVNDQLGQFSPPQPQTPPPPPPPPVAPTMSNPPQMPSPSTVPTPSPLPPRDTAPTQVPPRPQQSPQNPPAQPQPPVQ